jgi:taurine--2-oxoglutarate transaminase
MVAPPKADFELKTRATQKLIRLLGFDNGKIFYTVSGAESVENALKMARHCTGRKTVGARARSYHGASLGALSVTGDWRRNGHIFFDPHVLRIPEPPEDPEGRGLRHAILEHGPDKIAAIVVETITGANGVIIPPSSWWKALGAVRAEFGIKVIVDEVLTGFGRTGHAFAFQQFEITPDMVTLGKAITGGYVPFGAVWTRQDIAEFYEDHVLSCGLTSYAHPLGLAVMEAVIDLLQETAFRDRARHLIDVFQSELQRIADCPQVKEVRQAGLLAAIDFEAEAGPTYAGCLEAGLHVVVKDGQIILAPPLVMDPRILRQCMGALAEVIQREQLLDQKPVGRPSGSQPAVPGSARNNPA